MTSPGDSWDQLHRELGLKPLLAWWAKVEIVLGLLAVAAGILGGMRLASWECRTGESNNEAAWCGMAALVVLGGYLTLAGHRSHLYQSSNRLTAHLAALIRGLQAPSRDHP